MAVALRGRGAGRLAVEKLDLSKHFDSAIVSSIADADPARAKITLAIDQELDVCRRVVSGLDTPAREHRVRHGNVRTSDRKNRLPVVDALRSGRG